MTRHQQLNTEFSSVLFADIAALYPQSGRQYDCAGISDIHYCQLGVLRALSSSVTGQEFLQYHADQNVAAIDPGHFFKALQSPRRLANITSLNDAQEQDERTQVMGQFQDGQEEPRDLRVPRPQPAAPARDAKKGDR
jgi:hypothetical protein